MMHRRLLSKIRSVRKNGVVRSARILLDKTGLVLLRKIYGFHPWHVEAPLSARPYRRTVAEMVNGLRPESVVEVGCGLGGILSLVKAKHRHGYDLDEGAVSAARLLRSRTISFTPGDMTSVAEPDIDVLILVNWIHDFSPQQLESWLLPLIPRTHYLLLDAIDADNPLDYSFKHDFAFLSGRAQLVSKARVKNEGRSFLLYKVSS